MGGEPGAHLRLGGRDGIVERRCGGKVGEPAEAMDVVDEPDRLVDLPIVEAQQRLLHAAIEEIARAQCLAGARVAGHQLRRHGQQLERMLPLRRIAWSGVFQVRR